MNLSKLKTKKSRVSSEIRFSMDSPDEGRDPTEKSQI